MRSRSSAMGVVAVLLGGCTLSVHGLQPGLLATPPSSRRATPLALQLSDAPIVLAPIALEAPPGPDPYKLVHDDLAHIKASIKKLLKSKSGETSALSSNGVLTMAAREFMDRKGKSFRPMVVLLIGSATHPDFTTGNLHSKLAVISEMIHTASLIHADVLEDHETDTSQGTLVHQEVTLEVGNKVCILAGDFLLAKAAVELSMLENSAVTVRSIHAPAPAQPWPCRPKHKEDVCRAQNACRAQKSGDVYACLVLLHRHATHHIPRIARSVPHTRQAAVQADASLGPLRHLTHTLAHASAAAGDSGTGPRVDLRGRHDVVPQHRG